MDVQLLRVAQEALPVHDLLHAHRHQLVVGHRLDVADSEALAVQLLLELRELGELQKGLEVRDEEVLDRAAVVPRDTPRLRKQTCTNLCSANGGHAMTLTFVLASVDGERASAHLGLRLLHSLSSGHVQLVRVTQEALPVHDLRHAHRNEVVICHLLDVIDGQALAVHQLLELRQLGELQEGLEVRDEDLFDLAAAVVPRDAPRRALDHRRRLCAFGGRR